MTKKFYQMSVTERIASLQTESGLSSQELSDLCGVMGLPVELAENMVENAIGSFALPLGIARNFLINGKKYHIPMAVEEPSVIAAASNATKMVAHCGGFRAECPTNEIIGQLQLVSIPDMNKALHSLQENQAQILQIAADADPLLVKLGGGPCGLEFRPLMDTLCGPMLILHLIMNPCDAMGANTINTALEKITPLAERCSGGKARLRILSNNGERRIVHASCTLTLSALASADYDGEEVRTRMMEAYAFAEADPYRAVTHNKGIMNGIDALAIATGNDWRAIEAAVHSFAARGGTVKPLSHYKVTADGNLSAEIEIPICVGIIGGATRVHPSAKAALRLMKITSAGELATVMACLGLAQNIAALRALATDGIQKGHMRLHARQVAIAAGAMEDEIRTLSERMIADGTIRLDDAQKYLQELKESQ